MEVTASLKRVRVSPRKARLVVDAVRGKQVSEAHAITAVPAATRPRLRSNKLLQSVAANAENNYDLDPEDLWIKEIFADDGPTMKRFKPKARGRVGRILKRSCTHHGRSPKNREGR